MIAREGGGLHLTRHFIENWRQRVGGEPRAEDVCRVVERGIRLQVGRKLTDLQGRPWNTLSIYWDPVRNIIVKIDRWNRAAVSVISPAVVPVKDDFDPKIQR